MRGISIGLCRGVLVGGGIRLQGNNHSAAACHFRDVWGHDPSEYLTADKNVLPPLMLPG